MRLLVCGNRDWTCVKTIDAWMRAIIMSEIRRGNRNITLINGCAVGVDSIAAEVFVDITFPILNAIQGPMHTGVEVFPVESHEWQSLGRRAGPLRNQRMFDEGKPTRCLAFGRLAKPNSEDDSGTGNMVKICNRGGIVVTVVPKPGVMP